MGVGSLHLQSVRPFSLKVHHLQEREREEREVGESVHFKSTLIPILFDINCKHTFCSVMISEGLYTDYPLQTPALRERLLLYPGRLIGGAVATRMRAAVISLVLKVRLSPPLLHSKRIRSSPNADFFYLKIICIARYYMIQYEYFGTTMDHE